MGTEGEEDAADGGAGGRREGMRRRRSRNGLDIDLV